MTARLCVRDVCVAAETSSPLLPGCLWGDAAEHIAALACLSKLLSGGASRLLRNIVLDFYALCAALADAVLLAQQGPVAVLAPRSCGIESLEKGDEEWRARLRCGSGETVLRCRVLREREAQPSGPPHSPGIRADGSA